MSVVPIVSIHSSPREYVSITHYCTAVSPTVDSTIPTHCEQIIVNNDDNCVLLLYSQSVRHSRVDLSLPFLLQNVRRSLVLFVLCTNRPSLTHSRPHPTNTLSKHTILHSTHSLQSTPLIVRSLFACLPKDGSANTQNTTQQSRRHDINAVATTKGQFAPDSVAGRSRQVHSQRHCLCPTIDDNRSE